MLALDKDGGDKRNASLEYEIPWLQSPMHIA
jgi:hypothetical protein